jgi:cell division protease FtsH
MLGKVSEHRRQRVDEEIQRIVGEAHDEAARLLADNRDRLDALAEALIREETLDEPEVAAAAGLEPPADVAPGAGSAHPDPVRREVGVAGGCRPGGRPGRAGGVLHRCVGACQTGPPPAAETPPP